MGDAIKHQHGRQRQLCVARAKHLTVAAGKEFLPAKLIALNHKQRSSSGVITRHPEYYTARALPDGWPLR
jgi:hypothetical protein